MSAASKFKELSRLEKLTVVSALFMLPVSAVTLHIFGLQRALKWFLSEPKKVSKLNHEEQFTLAVKMAHAVDIAASRGFYHANCLKRSLVLGRLLRSQGIASELRIGTRLNDSGFFAHAWLLCGDAVVNDRADIAEDFRVFEGSLQKNMKLVFHSKSQSLGLDV